ncbi:MAG: hypothetical protein ACPGRX_05205 [Bdellovibrionales bacterium]
MSWNWQKQDDDAALAFLNAVRDADNPVLFEPSVCEIYKHPLPFYDGYDLIRIVNRYSPPFPLFDYLSNGENHFYLDGSDAALQTICARGSVTLDAHNVLQYIDLYLSYVYERGNSLVYIRDPQDTGFKGSDAMGVHFQAIKQHRNVNVTWNVGESCYEITAPLLYQDKAVESLVQVNKAGRIRVVKPVRVDFLNTPENTDCAALAHPRAQAIVEQCVTMLDSVPTGKQLLQLIEDHDIGISVISAPNIQAFAVNKPMVYLLTPAAQQTADYYQALVLAGALHDAGQIVNGYKRPSIDEPDQLLFDIQYDKNLKLIIAVCRIVDEFLDINIHEPLNILRRLGLQEVYAGYRAGMTMRALFDVYIDGLVAQGAISEGGPS